MIGIARTARMAIKPLKYTKPIFAVSYRFNSTNTVKKDSLPYNFSSGPVSVKYTEEHEWISLHPDGTAFVGITNYAADALGDATFVELPEVGDVAEKGESIGAVESVKSASEVYSPVSGEVTAVNNKVSETPGLLNEDPMGEGWLAQIKIGDVEGEFANNESLMDLEQYTKSLEEDH